MSRWIVQERAPAPRGRAGWAALALIPSALLVFLLARYALDVPLIDQWSFVPTIEREYTGTLTFDALRAQHGEHRPFFPRLIMLGLASATGWNILYEIALNVVLGTALYLVLVKLFAREISSPTQSSPAWLWALLSLIVFSLSQWENWLWGWQLMVFLNVLCVAVAILLLTTRPLAWRHLAGAAIFGIVATYSFGNGLLVWPIGLGILALAPRSGPPKRALAAVWIGVSALVIASYLAGFQRGDSPMSVEGVVTRPVAHLRYVLTFIGSPLASFGGSAFPPRDTGIGALVGCGGFLALVLAVWWVVRRRPEKRDRSIAFLALAAYAVSSGFVAAVSRLRFGISQAYASRYTTVANLFWIGLIGVIALGSARGAVGGSPAVETPRRASRTALVAIAALILASSLASVHVFPERHNLLQPARAEMVRGQDLEMLKRLHPEVEQVTYGLVALRRLRLSVFRNAKVEKEAVASAPHPLLRFGQIVRPQFRPESLRLGQAVVIPVDVTNPTTEIWSAAGTGPGTLSVRLGYHWFDYAGRPAVYEAPRALLPHDVGPGDSVSLKLRVAPPPLPGTYTLRMTMVQEGVQWFDTVAGGQADLSIEVVP